MTDTTNPPIQVLGEWTNDVATYEIIRDIAGRIAVRPKGRPEWPEWVEWRLDPYVALGWVSYDDDGTPHGHGPLAPKPLEFETFAEVVAERDALKAEVERINVNRLLNPWGWS